MIRNSFKYFKNSKYNFKYLLRFFKAYNQIKKTNLFDEDFYKKTHPNVKGDALGYYLVHGAKKYDYPSLNFDSDLYREIYPDVDLSNLNPLMHYILYGKDENRIICKVPHESRKQEICKTNLAYLNNFQFEEEPLVSIIILNRNGLTHLKRLFEDFDKKTNYSNYEIIVVDNASTDESINYLKGLNLPISIIENKENVSFSKGNNQAAEIANGEFILLLNNDIEPTFGWLNELVGTIMQDEKVAMVGSKLVFPFYYEGDVKKSFKLQHSGDIFAERMKPCCMYAINKFNKGLDLFDESLNKIKESIAVTAAVALIRKNVYEKVGGLDEDYFYGLEDVDFCLKLHKEGYITAYCGSSLLFHHESSTRIKSKDYFKNDEHNFTVFQNKWQKYLSREMLLDKINNRKFFSNKQLKIVIVGLSNDFTSQIAKDFNSMGYEVDLISNFKDKYLGNSSDILISFSDEFDLSNTIKRDDLFKVYVGDLSNYKSNSYNLALNQNNYESDTFAVDFIELIKANLSKEGFTWE